MQQRYSKINLWRMAKKGKISRRKFVVRSILGGTALIVGTTYLARNPIRRQIAGMANSAELPYLGNTDDPLLWFEIRTDNTIILHCPKVEMGQGTFTGLAQIAAEELEVDMKQIEVVHASTATGNIDGVSTGGSNSISSLWTSLRELAATMREMIKTEAAAKWQVSKEVISASGGVLRNGELQMTFGEAITGVTEWSVPEVPGLKDPKTFKIIGQPVPRVDLLEKVTGAPIFGFDVSMPDMLYGAIVRPTTIGASYVSADTKAAEEMPGVIRVVKEKDFVGVVARSYSEAENAKEKIEVEWKVDKVWTSREIEEMIKVGEGTPYVIQKEGKARVILEEDGIISTEYSSPIGAHAQLEPNGAVAFVEEDKATIWISTQVVKITRSEVAKCLGMDEEKVIVEPTFLGGGFGRRLHTPHAKEVALLSKAVGKPVKCFFTRKEEFQHDTFRPPTHHILKAKLRSDGLIEAMEHNVSSGDVMFGSPLTPSIAEPLLGADIGAWRGGMIQYSKIPNFRAVSWRVKLPFATSWWRSLGLLANTFAIESFMDELAERAGRDPVDFRIDHIQDDDRGYRLKEVIRAAAENAGWTNEVRNGRAMGFAASTDANTPVAQVAEVSVEQGEIRVHKVICAIDPGMIVNPDQVRAQCEGSIVMGLSAALFEEMKVIDGELQPEIYGPYRMALMKHSPKEIKVVLLENSETPGAVGEPPIGPIGAAIANAAYKITGKRLRKMPLQST